MKGAKVQNLPRGGEARISAMLNLPAATEAIVQKWFSENLSMIEPEPVGELIEMYSLYEDSTEVLSESDAKRYARSCLMHLFSDDLSEDLINFLKSSPDGSDPEPEIEQETESEEISTGGANDQSAEFLDSDLAHGLIAVLRGKDPDEFLASQSPSTANFISGLYSIRNGESQEAQSAIENLNDLKQTEIAKILSDYSISLEKKTASVESLPSGIRIIQPELLEEPIFDFDRDQIIGKCTKDHPETAVFVQQFAVQTWDGRLLSLAERETRKLIFPNSGDVQSFTGQHFPKQPKKHELGIWHVDRNESSTADHFTNFHIKGTKTNVYEVHLVPFSSTDYESVREYLKEHFSQFGLRQTVPYLFQLRDGVILGCPHGKDMSKDEGYSEGLPYWRTLDAFRFEGRLLVLGPLPAHELYECASLTTTLKKFFSSIKDSPDGLTRSQQRKLQEWISSGEWNKNEVRKSRLLEEIEHVGATDEGIEVVLEEAMNHDVVKKKIEQRVEEIVEHRAKEKSNLLDELDQIRKESANLRRKITKQEKELKDLPQSINKVVKESLKKAKSEVLSTLGEVVIYDALINGSVSTGEARQTLESEQKLRRHRLSKNGDKPLINTLKSIGLSSKYSSALEITGNVVLKSGLILVVEGLSARFIAESWGSRIDATCSVFDCGIGLTDDNYFNDVLAERVPSVVILDANLSPVDVYARNLIDIVQQNISDTEKRETPKVIFSLSNGLAGLPLPKNVDAISVRVSLDKTIEFLREEEAQIELEEFDDDFSEESWGGKFWRPAMKVLLSNLRELPSSEAALVLSVIKADVENEQQEY